MTFAYCWGSECSLPPPKSSNRSMRYVKWLGILLVGIVLGAAAWAALTPIRSESRDVIFEIPKGTWARRMAGNKIEILPSKIRLTLGLKHIFIVDKIDDDSALIRSTL